MPRKSLNTCCDQDFERLFDAREAEHDLEAWRRNGLPPATRELIEVLRADGLTGAVLDIGAGVGMVHLELLEAGAASAVDVDASSAYLEAARGEAERRGLVERVEYRYGDAVELAASLPPAEVVAMDRVICCYPDLAGLLAAAVATGPRLIGLVHPTDGPLIRASMTLFNAVSRLFRRHHSFYVHRRAEIDRLLRAAGFAEHHRGGGRFWKVTVYARSLA
ncbi:MAG: class I SAM-dependent methyltransferase [Chloroflexota bacterium]|nr:class I SAM-dependent methyltransferase [Chloroflexota bacterium]